MSDKENKKRKRHFDRVTLEGAALDRVDSWIKQVESLKAGVVMSRKDILNWLIENMPERLTSSQEKGLADSFYSELRYIQFAAREIRAAALRGERLTLKEIEARGVQSKDVPIKRQRKSKVENSADKEPPQNSEIDSTN